MTAFFASLQHSKKWSSVETKLSAAQLCWPSRLKSVSNIFFVSSFELEQNLFRSFELKSVQLKIDRIAADHFFWKLGFDQIWFLCISLTNTHRQQNTHTRICTLAFATHPQMHRTRIRLHNTWASLGENTYIQPHFLSKTLLREHASLKRLPNFVMLTPKRTPT